MKNTHIILTVLLSFILTSGIQAQDKAFRTEIDKDTIFLGDQVIMTISLDNINADFHFPELDSCYVTQPSQRSNIQIINGKMTSSKEYDYSIIPLTTGLFTIPEIMVIDGAEEFFSEPAVIVVLPNPNRPDMHKLDKDSDYHSPEKPRKKRKVELPPGTKIIRT